MVAELSARILLGPICLANGWGSSIQYNAMNTFAEMLLWQLKWSLAPRSTAVCLAAGIRHHFDGGLPKGDRREPYILGQQLILLIMTALLVQVPVVTPCISVKRFLASVESLYGGFQHRHVMHWRRRWSIRVFFSCRCRRNVPKFTTVSPHCYFLFTNVAAFLDWVVMLATHDVFANRSWASQGVSTLPFPFLGTCVWKLLSGCPKNVRIETESERYGWNLYGNFWLGIFLSPLIESPSVTISKVLRYVEWSFASNSRLTVFKLSPNIPKAGPGANISHNVFHDLDVIVTLMAVNGLFVWTGSSSMEHSSVFVELSVKSRAGVGLGVAQSKKTVFSSTSSIICSVLSLTRNPL